MIERLMENNALTAVLFGAALIIASIMVLNYLNKPTMEFVNWTEQVYRVQPGESLWQIAMDHCPAGVNHQEWIREVRELNRMESNKIFADQWLVILTPAKEDER